MNIRQLAESAITDLGVDSSLLAVKWANDRFQELVSTRRIKPLRTINELVVPANLTTGTVSVTQDSTSVTGNAAAVATWTPDIIGRYFRVDSTNEWYPITGFTGSTLKLGTPYVGSTDSSASYKIVKRYYDLEEGLRYLGTMVNLTLGVEMRQWSSEKLVNNAPIRTTTGGGPYVYVEHSISDNWKRRLELYPPNTSRQLIAYTGYKKPEDLGPRDLLPSYVDSYIIQTGVKMNALDHAAMKALQSGNSQVGGTLANLAARQRTLWEKAKGDFQMKNAATDDATVILESYGKRKSIGDVMDARDHVYVDWSPLS